MNEHDLKNWLHACGFNLPDPLSAHINSTIKNTTTPLMHAARMGNAEVLEALLALGADPRLLNADSNGALWFACFANSTSCAAALIQSGAPLDSQNVNGATALIYCASAGKTALVKLLLDAAADQTLMTLDDFTALELAANPDCLRLLKAARKAAIV